MSINEIMNPTYQRHFWYAGCKATNKTRDFYLTTGRDLLMSPDYKQEILTPGISKYTSLPITLDDKVNITQLRYDYQKNIELHQMSFQDWLQHSNVNNLMTQGDKPLEFDEPQILKNITQLGHRDFFLANWMMDYSITKLGFEMWYNYIGKDLKIPCDYKQIIANETPKRSPHQDQTRKLAQMPKLENYIPSPEPEPTKRRKICNLPNPPDTLKETKKEAKAESTSWAAEVEQQFPLDTVQEEDEHREQSQFSMEPIFFNAEGKKLNKRERQQLYADKEAEFRQIIRDEAKEKADDDLSQDQYQSIFRTMTIKLPPMKRTIWELEAIKANTILDPRIEVPWVEPHHFMPLGKFAHIYIPKYVYIPKDVFKKSSIQLEVDTTSYTAFWRQLREAQQEAQRLLHTMLDHEQLRSLYKTDHRKMLKGQLSAHQDWKSSNTNTHIPKHSASDGKR